MTIDTSTKVRKVLAITYSRSEYDLLSYLYKFFSEDPGIDFRLLIGGAHLSPQYGLSINQIIEDEHVLLTKLTTLLDCDSDIGRVKSAAILMLGAIEPISEFNPELLIYAGDREEVMIGAMIAGYLKIPSMHFFAGDHDLDGLIDNPIRHAVSRMSAFQIVSMDEHRERLIATGLNPDRIFVIGSCALDKFRLEKKLSKKQLVKRVGGKSIIEQPYAFIIHHALMNHESKCVEELSNIIEALREREIPAIVNSPNIDPGSKKLLNFINNNQNDDKLFFINNLPRIEFVNIYRHAIFQIGNSSSGTCEAASIPIPVVNVGHRMVGRRAMSNVIFCGSDKRAIGDSIDKVLSKEFYSKEVKGIKNIYGDGYSSQRAFQLIKHLDTKGFEAFRVEDPLEMRNNRNS
jgi:GDP/UDP-N,N'-diacetylbacillosamine 2-epimerase (hydrolysing)